MALTAFGINHDTASVDIREKVAIAPDQMPDALQSFCEQVGVDEVAILSTCNRTEILTVCSADKEQDIVHWLGGLKRLAKDQIHSCCYSYSEGDAIRHMMKVASGLDSMILGEPQILGQMKSAYAVAQDAGTISGPLGHAFQHTFSFAKRVRTETAIGQNPVSVAFAAVHLSQRIFADLKNTKAMLIGAGETIDLVAKHLKEKNIGHIIVANRTLTRAKELAAQYNAEEILLTEIADRLHEVDIVISSTASELPVLGKGAVERAIKKRKRKPIFMVDIAVPRDIEPEVNDLKDVFLYTVDDLRDIIDENKRARKNEVVKADLILDEGVEAYLRLQKVNDVVPVLRAFRSHAEKIKLQELEKAVKQLEAGNEPDKVLESMARLITNKLIHTPSVNLKKAAEEGYVETVEQFASLFELDVDADDIGNNE